MKGYFNTFALQDVAVSNIDKELEKLEREFFTDLLEKKLFKQELESAFAAIEEKNTPVSQIRMNTNTLKSNRKNLIYCGWEGETEYEKLRRGNYGTLWNAEIFLDNSVSDGLIVLVGVGAE